MTIDEMDAMDDDRCDGCDEAIDDTSRFLISQQVMLPFWSWVGAPYPGDVHKSDIKAKYLHKRMVSLGLELPRSTHRRSSQDLRGDELDETTAI